MVGLSSSHGIDQVTEAGLLPCKTHDTVRVHVGVTICRHRLVWVQVVEEFRRNHTVKIRGQFQA